VDEDEVNHPTAARGPGAAPQASRAASEHTAAVTGSLPHELPFPAGLNLPFKQEGLQLQQAIGMGLSVMDQSMPLDMKFGSGLQATGSKPAAAFGLQLRPGMGPVLNLAASDSSGASEDAAPPPQASQPPAAPLPQSFQLQTTPELQALLAMSANLGPTGGMQPPLPLGMPNLANGMQGFKPILGEGVPEQSYQDGLDLSQIGANGFSKGRGPMGLTAPAAAVPGQRGKSSYRGVSWCEKVKKWRALLWDGQKQVGAGGLTCVNLYGATSMQLYMPDARMTIQTVGSMSPSYECALSCALQRFLGHFVTDLEAARAYDRAVLDLRGPDGKTNFPSAMYTMEDQSSQQQHTKLPVSCFKVRQWADRWPHTLH
jgi:hypothetical protein